MSDPKPTIHQHDCLTGQTTEREMTDEESAFEYLNSLHPEDSTREYNPVEHYKDGGIARGCGKVMSNRRKVTKYY